MMDIYVKSLLSKILHGIDEIRKVRSPAKMVYVHPDAYRDIFKMKKIFKKPKSDIAWIRKLKHFPGRKAKWINCELSIADIDFIGMTIAMEQDIYRALKVPKEYLRPIKGIHITNGHRPFITNTPTI